MSSAYLRLLIFLPAILIPACASSRSAFRMMYSAYTLNKQGDSIQPWRTPFLTQWTWVWVGSGSWWWTGEPGMLWFVGSQRVGHDWATELNCIVLVNMYNFLVYSKGHISLLKQKVKFVGRILGLLVDQGTRPQERWEEGHLQRTQFQAFTIFSPLLFS